MNDKPLDNLINAAKHIAANNNKQLTLEEQKNIVCEVYGIDRDMLERELLRQRLLNTEKQRSRWLWIKGIAFLSAWIFNLVMPWGLGVIPVFFTTLWFWLPPDS